MLQLVALVRPIILLSYIFISAINAADNIESHMPKTEIHTRYIYSH